MNKTINKFSVTFSIIFYGVFIIALIAPFTFQKSLVSPTKNFIKEPIKLVKPAIKEVVEQPLHNVILPNFSAINNVQDKKRQFFDFLRPAIIAENIKIKVDRSKLESILTILSLGEILSADDLEKFQSLVNKYKVSDKYSPLQQAYELLSRIDVIPQALVLVQAANESAWGTSRFARIGLNFFGIWCYREGCGMVPNGRNSGAKHEVASFQSVEGAIKRYLYNINTHAAYQMFRTIRSQLREHNQPLSAQILATGLLPYSERGTDYVLDITNMIRQNQKYLTVEKAE